MQKIIPLFCLILLISSCRKSSTTNEPESSDQLLTKIVKTYFFSGGLSYSETLSFDYDNTKKIIAEANNVYYRDNKGRIIKISKNSNSANRLDTYVYYANGNSGTVAYTRSDYKVAGGFFDAAGNYIVDSVTYHDSTVYVHENNKLTRIIGYFSDNGINYFGYQPDKLGYDGKGNLKEWTRTLDNGVYCTQYYYYEYDYLINPFYSDDEVRRLEVFWGTENISPNNLLRGNHTSGRHFEYRDDGRPRSCTVSENGKEVYKLAYYYK